MLALLAALAFSPTADAFCGTYVGGVEDTLTNRVSNVVMVREGDKTTITMTGDVSAGVGEFGMLVPVPGDVEDVKVLEDLTLLDRIDRYAGPRLVSYTCEDLHGAVASGFSANSSSSFGCEGVMEGIQDQLMKEILEQVSGHLGLDLSFGEGDYDLELLEPASVAELGVWATTNGWQLDPGAAAVLERQVRQDTKYLAVTVDLDDDVPVRRQMLKPIQFSYTSDSFSLPIELGAAHAEEVQDVVLHVITDTWDGQVGVSNYPEFQVEDECLFRDEDESFTDFYSRQIKQGYHAAGGEAAWTMEYVWAPAKCDPCPDEGPLDEETMRAVGYEGHVGSAVLTRIRARFHPDFVRGDLVLYGSGLSGQEQLRYVLHDPALESDFPICEEGWSPEPGSCEDEPTDPVPAGGPALPAGALVVGLVALVRRRMERAISHT